MLALATLTLTSFVLGIAAAGVLSATASWFFDRLPPVTDEDLRRLKEALRG